MTRKTLINKIEASYLKCKYATSFLKSIKKLGFKHIGGGQTREVFANGKLIIKIGCIQENDKEISVYNNLKKHPTWKYATVPIYKFCINKKIKNDVECGKYVCYFYSILIAAQAKNIEIRNPECNFPRVENSDVGFIVQNKKYHKQALILNDVFNDCHSDNLMVFGNSLVMVDLNCEYSTCFCENSAKKYEKCVNFKEHKKLWTKQEKHILQLKS